MGTMHDTDTYVRIRGVMNKEIGKLIKEIGAVTEDRVPRSIIQIFIERMDSCV